MSSSKKRQRRGFGFLREKKEWIVPIVGNERDIACVIELSAEIFEPGVVKRNTDHSRTWFALGELHGRITSRLREITQILSAVGKAETSGNIRGAKWSMWY